MIDKIKFNFIKNNIDSVKKNIQIAKKNSGNDSTSVKLIVVTKARLPETVRFVILAGAKYLGENYPNEAINKVRLFDTYDILWQMIGHVQSRKAAVVAENFKTLHSLDSVHLAEKLQKSLEIIDRKLPTLIELNVSHEESKFGFPAWDDNSMKKSCEIIQKLNEMTNIQVIGLMTMPPFSEDPEKSRQYFVKMRYCQDYLRKKLPSMNWDELSMGTSMDYIVAIQEGATYVRIGRAIFDKE